MFNSFLKAGYNKSEFDTVQANIAKGIAERPDSLTEKAADILATFDGNWDKLTEDEAVTLSTAVTAAEDVIAEAGFDTFLAKIMVGASDPAEVEKFKTDASHAGYQAGLTAAACMIVAEAKPEAYAKAYVNPNGNIDGDTEFVGPTTGYDLEGFDNFVFDKFSVKSAMTAGIVAATSPFSQTFFRPSVLPASQNGLDLRVTVPYTYRRTYRPGTGKENKMARKYLVRAPLDHTIMEDNSTDVIPVADAARADVLQGEVPVKTIQQHGIDVATRPLKYGTKVDLIDVSSNSELIRLGDMTEQDTLDPLVTIGRQVLLLTKNDDSVKSHIEVDLSTHIGAMLNYVAEGFEKSSSTQQEFTFWVHGTDEDYANVAVETALGLGTDAAVSLVTDANWRIKVTARISASIDEDANLVVDAADVSIVSLHTGADYKTVATEAQLKELTDNYEFNIEKSGYFPDARRSNSNMRDIGTIVDAGRTTKYRLTAPLGAPISTVKPLVAMGNGVSIDGLSSAARLRDLGTCVTKLFDFEKKLIQTKDLPGNQAAIGGQLVTSTHKTASLNVLSMVRNRDSRHGLEDLRSHMVNAITMLANHMIVESGYLPALEMYTGSRSNFEVIVVTDPIIGNHLMTSGDGRTLGNNRRFKVSEVDDERMRGKIYLSLARTDTTGADVMSFGTQIVCAPFIHQAQVTLGASTHQMTQIIPRTSFHVTLPILGRIDVEGLEEFYLQPTP